MKRWVAIIPLAALAALAVMFFGWTLKRDPHVSPDELVGKPVPAVAVDPLAGGAPTPLNAAVQGPALINVFASWCAPCRTEQPQLLRLKKRGVRIIGVAWKDDPAKTQTLLGEIGDPFASVYSDRNGRAAVELGISGAPETFVVNSKGVIVDKWPAPLTDDDADRLVRELNKAG
jgi:cytochrome c biogenesis protein CcmG/thiol:disulfide interchange protein DsbE